jgi:16S rRNA (cytosine967-C5)-methyltransferase
MSSSRGVALEAIRRVIDQDAYSNLVIPSLLARSGLDRRDRAFAAELAYGTLRRRLVLDAAIEEAGGRPMTRMTSGAAHLLRLGAYQLLFADVAPHAAVGETVELTGRRERGFVNAVLRRIAARPPEPPPGHEPDAVQRRIGLIAWAFQELRHIVGDEAEAAAAALVERAPLSLRVNTCRVGVEEVLGSLGAWGARRGPVDPECVLVDRGEPSRLPGWEAGAFWAIDQASAVVARAVDARPGAHVLDACAGPGGKTAVLSCSVGPGGTVVAGDVHPRRAGLVRATLGRLGLDGYVVVHDATRPPLRTGWFDRVLVDAPCSGIGSARRRPELLWRPRKDRLSTLARRQVELATAGGDLLRPGGRLVYSVCTFPRAETDAACDAIVRHRPDLVPVRTAGPDGDSTRHRLWPHRHGTDGMFYAVFERTA